tara:strand:+ start:286 stop:702 length:417 start_codon:yes stop_codon:yes gene_type:complete
MYNSSSAPSGWYLCNGSNGTPDLRNRFVIGAGSSYSQGATGGSKNAVVVSHTHGDGNYAASGGSHNHVYTRTNTNQGVDTDSHGHDTSVRKGVENMNTGGTGNHNHNITGNSGNATNGVSGTNKNLPPYYALTYIMKA